MNAIELIAALKGADEETAMELVERLQCGEIDCSVLPTGKDNAVLQAQIWAQEARTQKGIVDEIGKLVGCSNDWEMVGAVKAALSANGGEAVTPVWDNKVLVSNIVRAFWRRIYTYKDRYPAKELPREVPIELYVAMSTALMHLDNESLNPKHPAPPSVAVPEGWKLVPIEPTEEMWSGLARHIIMWMDFNKPTGEALFGHLSRCGLEIPAWLRAEVPEDKSVPPKGSRATAIYKAMLTAAPSPDHSGDTNEVDAAPASFGSARELADWLDSLYETLEDGSFTGSKWDVAQAAAKAVRGHDHIADAGKVVPDAIFADEFSEWWEEHGQFVRSGGGDYERTFAFEAWRHLYPRITAPAADGGEVVPVGWPEINKLIQQYVSDYEYTDGEGGYYTPTDWQRHMIEDAIHGVLSEVPLHPATHPAQPRNVVQAEALEDFAADIEEELQSRIAADEDDPSIMELENSASDLRMKAARLRASQQEDRGSEFAAFISRGLRDTAGDDGEGV